MKVGIVSDSHGRESRLAAALEVLVARGAEVVVHCGDIGSVECVWCLGAAGVPAYAVAGNMDRHADVLAAAAVQCGVNFSEAAVEVPLGDGSYLAATHGADQDLLAELTCGGQFPYVCHGHTHRARSERIGGTRVINPGALAHGRKPRRPTAALLDTDTDTVEHIRVPR